MAPPAVSCQDCSRTWNSASLVEGLRLLGTCPRCGGELNFRDAEGPASDAHLDDQRAVAPHLVLGIPRR